jgi:hypothetical protein
MITPADEGAAVRACWRDWDARPTLVRKIEAHLEEKGISARDFSIKVTGDHRWFNRLKQGNVTLASIERAEALMRGETVEPPKRRRPSQDVAA